MLFPYNSLNQKLKITWRQTKTNRSRRRRRIQLALVEKGTCFSLWQDVVDNLTRYEPKGEAFHVMHLSTDHLSRVGLSFDCPRAAEEFLGCLRMLTADPANISLSGPSSGKSRFATLWGTFLTKEKAY